MKIQRKQRFNYCPHCGNKLEYRLIKDRKRLTCISCGSILYENPIVGVAAIIFNEENHILLGRRIGGQYPGKWCIPCGYLEYDEDVYDGVKREIKEETNLDIDVEQIYTVQSNFHNPDQYSVGIWFLAQVKGGIIQAGDDLDQVAFFPLDNVPPLAFPTDRVVINNLGCQGDGSLDTTSSQ